MKTKTLGITLIVLGIIMIAYSIFTFLPDEKVVGQGMFEINNEVNHSVPWSPIIGLMLLIGGITIFVSLKKVQDKVY